MFKDETIEYEARENGLLRITHNNAVFECAVERIYAAMTVNDHTYIIEEKAQEGPVSVNCVCPYDLGYDIGPLTEGEEYTVSIRRGKSEESEVAKFIFTYSPTVKGQISKEWFWAQRGQEPLRPRELPLIFSQPHRKELVINFVDTKGWCDKSLFKQPFDGRLHATCWRSVPGAEQGAIEGAEIAQEGFAWLAIRDAASFQIVGTLAFGTGHLLAVARPVECLQISAVRAAAVVGPEPVEVGHADDEADIVAGSEDTGGALLDFRTDHVVLMSYDAEVDTVD